MQVILSAVMPLSKLIGESAGCRQGDARQRRAEVVVPG